MHDGIPTLYSMHDGIPNLTNNTRQMSDGITNLIIGGIVLLDSIGHMEGDIAVGKVPLREPIGKDTLLLSIGVYILHSVIRKMDLFGAIRIMLLTLLAKG